MTAARRRAHVAAALLVTTLAMSSALTYARATEPKVVGRLGFEGVWSMTYSPTANLVAVWSYYGDLRVLDGTTGAAVAMFPGAAGSPPAFSPDGRLVASSQRGKQPTIAVWDVASGQEVARLAGYANALAFSPDGAILAGNWAGITLWSVDTQEEAGTLEGHTRGVTSLAFTPDGNTLASGGNDGAIKLWDVAAAQEVGELPGPVGGTYSVAFGPHGDMLAGGGNGAIRLWDVARRQEIATLTGHTDVVQSVEFSPDGATLASVSSDRTVRLWDVAAGHETVTLAEYDERGVMAAFSLDGASLVTGRGMEYRGADDRAERLINRWDVASARVTHSFGDPAPTVGRLTFSPDGAIVATAGGAISIWNVASERRVATLDGRAPLAFTADGSTLASLRADEGVVLWDVPSWRQTGRIAEAAGNLAFTPDGATLASTGEFVTLWDVGSARRIATLLGADGGNTTLAISPDGRTLASGGRDFTIRLWDVAFVMDAADAVGHDVPLLAEFARLPGHVDQILDLEFSPDSAVLASGSRDNSTKLWDVATGGEVASLRGVDRSRAISFSPDGQTVASVGSSYDGTTLWDVGSRRPVAKLPVSGHGFVYALAFSPAGGLLAVGGTGATLWRVPDSASDVLTAVGPQGKADAIWARVKQAASAPRETAFLPNYPNPFNPETWIPFDLCDDAKVVISIYDASGTVVRRLDVGERSAGAYRTRDRAAYWDGANERGEAVGSGVYFVEMVAGDYRSMRRIALRK